MPVKKVKKTLQKQKQSQKQVVNVNITQPKQRRARRKAVKRSSHSSSGSIIMNVTPPQLPFTNSNPNLPSTGTNNTPSTGNIQIPMMRQQQRTQIIPDVPISEVVVDNLADAPDRGLYIPFERNVRRTSLLEENPTYQNDMYVDYRQDEDFSFFNSNLIRQRRPRRESFDLSFFPDETQAVVPVETRMNVYNEPSMSEYVSGGAVSGGFVQNEIKRIDSKSDKTQQAREVIRTMTLSREVGGDVPLRLLLQKRWSLPDQPVRRHPTKIQRIRLYEAGSPRKGDEDGVK